MLRFFVWRIGREAERKGESMSKQTPLYQTHVALGGRMVDYAGYLLPVQFAGVLAEHAAVRQRAGLFDVSHMGEFAVEGPRALAALNYWLTNDFTSLAVGRCRYSPLCRADGGVLDDVLVYRLGEARYMIVVNAANRERDFAHLSANPVDGATLCDASDEYAQIALQGPQSDMLLRVICGIETPIKNYSAIENVRLFDVKCMISRTGYTGEDGFEIYCAPDDAPAVWSGLMAAGESLSIAPCGLAVRDLLRTEAAMPLYGHELSEEVTPIMAGLGVFVKMDKGDFIGRDALVTRSDDQVRVGLVLTERGIPREGCDILNDGQVVGRVTSGTMSPIAGPIAMGYVPKALAQVDAPLHIDVRGKALAARVVPLPFYKRAK